MAHRTKHDLVASGLRRAILTGKLRGGQRLHQSEIAAQFGVSRIPVREALRALDAEGLVTFHSHRGAIVTHLSAKEIQEVLEIRGLLEGMAGRYAACNITTEYLNSLRELIERMDFSSDNPREFLRLNLKFHTIINTASCMERLLEIITNLRLLTQHQNRDTGTYPKSIKHSQLQHRKIIRALEHGDGSAVEILTREHMLDAAKVLADYFEAYEADEEDFIGKQETVRR